MNGYVYILESGNGKYYIGSTDNLTRRLAQHRLGHTQTTARMESLKVVLIQEYDSLKTARRVEAQIKRLKRKDYIAKMVRDGKILLR